MSQSHASSTHLLHHVYGKPGREPSAEEGLPGCCSDDAQVSSVSTPSSRWSIGTTAGRTGVQLYPHRFRHHLNHTGLNRGAAEGDVMQLRLWRGRQDRAVNFGERLCPRLPHPLRRRYSNRRVLRFSRVRPLVPNHASPNKRGGPVCQRGDDVGEVPGSVGKTAHEEECAWPGFVAQVALRRVVWGARRSPNLCWCPASRLPIAGMSTRICCLHAAWLISCWGRFPLHTSTSSK